MPLPAVVLTISAPVVIEICGADTRTAPALPLAAIMSRHRGSRISNSQPPSAIPEPENEHVRADEQNDEALDDERQVAGEIGPEDGRVEVPATVPAVAPAAAVVAPGLSERGALASAAESPSPGLAWLSR